MKKKALQLSSILIPLVLTQTIIFDNASVFAFDRYYERQAMGLKTPTTLVKQDDACTLNTVKNNNLDASIPINIPKKTRTHQPLVSAKDYINPRFGIYACYPSNWISSEEIYSHLLPSFNPNIGRDLMVVRFEPAVNGMAIENSSIQVTNTSGQLIVFPSTLFPLTTMELRVHQIYEPTVINYTDQDRLNTYENERVKVIQNLTALSRDARYNLLPSGVSLLGSQIFQLIDNTTFSDVPAIKIKYTVSFAISVDTSTNNSTNNTNDHTSNSTHSTNATKNGKVLIKPQAPTGANKTNTTSTTNNSTNNTNDHTSNSTHSTNATKNGKVLIKPQAPTGSSKTSTNKSSKTAVQTVVITYVFSDLYLYKKPYLYSISYVTPLVKYNKNPTAMDELIKSIVIDNSTLTNH